MKWLLKHKTFITLFVITLFAFLIRAYHISWQCLMVDEQFTAQYITNSVSYIIQNSLASDYNPPTYYLLAKLSSFLNGSISNYSIRLPALIFGTLTIPAAYLAGKELRNETLGLLSAMIVAITYPLIYYSQNARPYSLVTLCFTLFIWSYIRIYTGKDKSNLSIVMLGVLAASCIWSHYFSAAPILVAFIFLVKQNWRITLSSVVDMLICLIPMAFLFNISQFSNRIQDKISGLAVQWYQMAMYIPNELLCWAWLLLAPLVIYGYHKSSLVIIRPLVWIGLSAPIILVISTYITGWMMPRYALLVAPLFIILAMYPISEYVDQFPITKKVVLASLIIFVIFTMNIMSLYSLWTWSWCPAMHMAIPIDSGFL